MKVARWLVLSLAFVLVLAACGGATEETPDATNEDADEAEGVEEVEDGDKSIVLGLDPYDYVKPPVYITKHILEDQGYDVEVQEGEVGILWAAMADGEIDAFFDIWDPNISGSLIEQYEGEYITAGTMYSDAPVGAVVPDYMDEIDSVEQLNDMKDDFGGKLYTIDEGSGTAKTTEVMVDEYDLDYEVVNSSDSAMVAHAQKQMSQEKPVVFIGWRPHIMFQKLDIKMLDDPKDVWAFDDVNIGVTTELPERLPEAYTMLSNLELPIEEIERWLLEMEEGADPEDLAEEWVAENGDTIEEWLSE